VGNFVFRHEGGEIKQRKEKGFSFKPRDLVTKSKKKGVKREIIPLTRERAISSFSYIDVAQGKSIVPIYGGRVSGAYILTREKFWSNLVTTSGATTLNAYGLIADIDFDLNFKTSQIIEGEMVVNVPMFIVNAAENVYVYCVVLVRKWNGTNETDILSEQSHVLSKLGGSGFKGEMAAVKFDMPRTKFEANETLRITVMFYGKDSGGSQTAGIAHDPKNSAVDGTQSLSSNMMVLVPFVVNL